MLRRSLGREILDDFRPSRLAMTIVTGTLSGFILVTLTISLAALVFRDDLADGLPIGVGLALFATLVIGVISVFASGLDGVVAGVQDNTSAVIGAAAAAIAAQVAVANAVPTVVAFIFVVSLLTAVALGSIGWFRLGGLVRFIPFPVVGGFLVATGVLILDGARSILFNHPSGAAVISVDSVARWLPGIVLGLLVLYLVRQRNRRAAMPWVIAGAVILTHVTIAVAGISRGEAVARGWLLGGLDDQPLWQFDALRLLGDADWAAVFGQGGAIITVVALAAISMMIKVHAIDQATGQDIDVDRELTVAGISIAAAAAGGGMPGYMHFSQTIMLRKLAGPRRGPALVAVLLSGVVLLIGGSVLSLMPTALVGALLVYLGATFLVDWLWDRRHSLERADLALILGAGAAVVILGFIPAIALGTIVAIVLFVVRYSMVDAVRHSYTLRAFRSSIERSPDQAGRLERIGDSGVVLEVHGFLFFGTAHRVFADPRLGNSDGELRFAIFDLTRVTGVDSSASMAIVKLNRRAAVEGFTIVLAGAQDTAGQLAAHLGDEAAVERFGTLDDAVEWCEERLLADSEGAGDEPPNLERTLAKILGSRQEARSTLRHFELRDYTSGEAVITHGSDSPGLFFLESGSLTAQLVTAEGETIRLRTMQQGTLVGEISLYLDGATTADVVADGPARVFHVSPELLEKIEHSNPEAAAAIHRLAARTLAGRVMHAERALRTLRE